MKAMRKMLNCADGTGRGMPHTSQPKRSRKNLKFADFEIEPLAGVLRQNGTRIRLQEQPFQVLVLLLERAGEVVSREELRHHLWSSDTFVDFDNSLNAAINKIREALGDSADAPRFIETLPRRGYRFLARVEKPGGSQPIQPATGAADRGGAALGRLLTVIPGFQGKTLDRRATGRLESIAVLPFENVSGDRESEYLSDGIAESLMNSLSEIKEIRVVSRGTAFRYKGRLADAQSVGRELGVEAVLTGRVLQRGDDLLVGVELVDVAMDAQLWGHQYNRKLSDIFNIQEDISSAISEKLVLRLTGQERKKLAFRRYTENREAYQLYLMGQHFFYKWTEQGMRKSEECFQRAIEKDPNFALAHAGLAQYYNYMSTLEFASPVVTIPKSLEAASRALELDNGLAEAYNYLAFHKFSYAWDWSGAAKLFERAVELRPDFVLAHLWHCLFLCATGRISEAVEASRAAVEFDPLSANCHYFASIPHYLVRDFDKTLQCIHRALELDSAFGWAHWILGLVNEECGNYQEAIASQRKAVELTGGLTRMLASLGCSYGLAGRKAEAQGIMGELQQRARVGYVPAFAFATVHLGLGNRDDFFEWLEKAFAERSFWLVYLNVDIKYDPVRSDPRFQEVIGRMKFPE